MFEHFSILWWSSLIYLCVVLTFSGLPTVKHLTWILQYSACYWPESKNSHNSNCDCRLRDVPFLTQSTTCLPAVLHYGLLSVERSVCLSLLWLIAPCMLYWLEINPPNLFKSEALIHRHKHQQNLRLTLMYQLADVFLQSVSSLQCYKHVWLPLHGNKHSTC